MKLWYGHGTEHSMNLVMIGSFKEVADAAKTKELIDWLVEELNRDVQCGDLEPGTRPGKFTPRLLELCREANIYDIAPNEFEQFTYDMSIKMEQNKIVVTTEESDVSALLKILVDKGARVEVFSAHDYPDAGYGRRRG